MSKQKKIQDDALVAESVENEQAVDSIPDLAKNEENPTVSVDTEISSKEVPVSVEKQKSTGKGVALLALLIALGVGGAGYFFGQQKFTQMETQLAQLARTAGGQPVQTAVEMPSFEAEKAQLIKLTSDYQQALARVTELENSQKNDVQQIQQLQAQIQKLGATPVTEPTTWLLSDADFLLNNALRKMVLDNDIDTTKSLLIEADNVLGRVNDHSVLTVREAIKNDLAQLTSVNHVDQNNLMQRLSQLANLVDDMPLVDSTTNVENSGEISDSVEDWQQNIEKSANLFLNHFIRVSDKNKVTEKAFVAPNQEIYLRENIRLRLQIAILTIPRQQNELYKQSLEAVSTWVRSYFDVKNQNVKTFLQEIDDLIEQSIYVDAPSRLQSVELLDKLLNKASKSVEKIQLDENKSLEALSPVVEQPMVPKNDEQSAEPSAEPSVTPQQ